MTTLLPSSPFLPDDSDMPEMPRPAPQPTSKPQLEDIFRGRRGGSAPLLTLKNLQAERLKYKQQAAEQKLNLLPIPENPTPELTAAGNVLHFQSNLEVAMKDRETFSPAQSTPRRFRGGSMSDRKRRDLSAEIASATSSALASVKRLKSPSPRHAVTIQSEDFAIEEEKATGPVVPTHDFKPSKDLLTHKKEQNSSPKPPSTDQKKHPSASQKPGRHEIEKKPTLATSVTRARSISPLRTLHQLIVKAHKDVQEPKQATKSDPKRKKMSRTEATDLAKRLQGTSTVYEKLYGSFSLRKKNA